MNTIDRPRFRSATSVRGDGNVKLIGSELRSGIRVRCFEETIITHFALKDGETLPPNSTVRFYYAGNGYVGPLVAFEMETGPMEKLLLPPTPVGNLIAVLADSLAQHGNDPKLYKQELDIIQAVLNRDGPMIRFKFQVPMDRDGSYWFDISPLPEKHVSFYVYGYSMRVL